jgi:predicted dipeptidase
MTDTLAQCLAAQQEPLKAALVELVRVPSVCDEGAEGFPFGPHVDLALRKALGIADRLGFRTHYGEGGYYGWAEAGDGGEMVGILGHLDVVPPGRLEDWANAPFEPVEQDGMLYGRGTQDDKGPLLAAMFAVKALLDAGVVLTKRVRFIFGTDEETLWRCINRYIAHEEVPDLGFSPDSAFPPTYAEKGLLQCQLVAANETALRFAGGSAFNAVPDSARYNGPHLGDLARTLDWFGYDFAADAGGIEVHGKSAHAMEAEKGVNAIARLCLALNATGVHSKTVRFVAEQVGEDVAGQKLFGDCADEPSGPLKFNIGKLELADQEVLSIDCRIPVTVPKEEVVGALTATAAQYGLSYREFDWLAPLYLPLDHFVVETLMRVYREITGDMVSRPVASGGATYARAMPNCVAFGALFPGEPITEHQPNERVVLANLHRAMAIYAHAVRELCQDDRTSTREPGGAE